MDNSVVRKTVVLVGGEQDVLVYEPTISGVLMSNLLHSRKQDLSESNKTLN